MLAILKKEINAFFASSIGYLVIAIFLVLNGLFLWLFKGEFNILDNGFADMSSFFLLAPWILLFLIPAVTMRSFSDERKQGTLELLLTKPVSLFKIVLGKYLGAFILILLALLPTLLYVYTVYKLGNPTGNIDFASTLGSYLGLLFLAAAYTAIGIFASSLTDNQIVAFITAIFLCFFFYIGMEGIADFTSSNFIDQLGMSAHYKSISRGVIDTRDLLYFISVILVFLIFTVRYISTKPFHKKELGKFLVMPIALLLLNILTHGFYQRFDLTQDKRYTLSEASSGIVALVKSPIIVDVFLDGTNLPSEFRRLQTETRQLLEEFKAENSQIHFNFVNPLEDSASREQNIQQLNERGLKPMQVTVQEAGKSSQEVIFPWALASYNNETVKIPLIKNKIGASVQELASNSIQHLEYAFADGFSKLVNPKRRKIAILKGNNQLNDGQIFDFVKTIKDYYYIAAFTLDSVQNNPQKTLEDIKSYDLVISAKPTEAFNEAEKLVLDQFTMSGGKSLWLLDRVAIEQDSLYNASGKNIAVARDLNMTDFFFKYGVRVNPVLINDLYSAPITLATGDGSEAQFQQLTWYYSPLVNATSKHPIVNNLNLIKFDFANQIDTLKNNVKKTVLLQSSLLTRVDGTPREISLEMTNEEPNPKQYVSGPQNLAVLLEGEFTSVYNNRVKPFEVSNFINTSKPTKMIVIADGDVIKNDIGRNGPLELGFDRWTGQSYGNKDFLLNAVNYLLDDNGLLNIRSKDISIAFLDYKKVSEEKTKWQVINIVLPLFFLTVFGFLFNFFRKRKYAK
ncbi:gliding motility-associated ABC transporter substrate-binding protein GldG [Bizionia argentinensis JUB59]|uniref:Gliding motility-associated ABC transporter substrate-binding protein GldG n=1 Tax=Bizionia argentinensis JUB59 TaxID=1046627 RepID=G2EGV9_9FLAO|nr:gliding motility-associated ABC transporter substrate-binding protein GldG [Bizionia argentinensis]EGV42338.1 gliding motility-associated ABC transporter substrate-binding protein GldG [Bizionia argentinensis JUB59]